MDHQSPLVEIDDRKFKAVISRDKNFTPKSVKRRLQKITSAETEMEQFQQHDAEE